MLRILKKSMGNRLTMSFRVCGGVGGPCGRLATGWLAALLLCFGQATASPPASPCVADSACGSAVSGEGCCERGSSELLFGEIEPLADCHVFSELASAREGLTEQGISFNASLAQFYMGVVDGGVDRSGRYSGHGEYVANIDGDKLLGMRGMFVKLKAEHRFGQSMAGTTGALLPSNVSADLPVADSEEMYLTNLLITQMFSENFGVFLGKTDTLDGDQNAFASGRGMSQFSNIAFVASPISLRTVPYSALATGFVLVDEGTPFFTFSVLNARDTTSTSGISDLYQDGVSIAPELRLPTQFFDLPGHQLFGGVWSSRNYAQLDQDPRIILPSVPIARTSDSWSVYYNFDQYLIVDPCDESRGWGVFGRAGYADPNSNPIEWFLSAGVGGNSMIPGRGADTFGGGFYYSGTSSRLAPVLSNVLGSIGDGYGTELFYNIAVTRSFRLTADAQFITPARESVDSSTMLGLRGVLTF